MLKNTGGQFLYPELQGETPSRIRLPVTVVVCTYSVAVPDGLNWTVLAWTAHPEPDMTSPTPIRNSKVVDTNTLTTYTAFICVMLP